jgi:hypothetical protein
VKKSARPTKSSSTTPDVGALRSSPIHGLTPLHENAILIDIDAIDIDPTNPGSITESMRYQRRAPSIRDSYDILGRIVYPIIVCKTPDGKARYMHVDGFGRLSHAQARGQQKIYAIVYPPLSLEQRICLRETLNAAQEPFDAVSIIRDLQELAKERHLDVTNEEHLRTLVRDLPEKVRKHERSLVMLARWHPKAVEALGESYRKDGKTIGLDKFKDLARILTTLKEQHPKTLAKLGGESELSLKLARMYLNKKFSEGSRSQDSIRKVRATLASMRGEDPSVLDFFVKEKSYTELPRGDEAPERSVKSELLAACQSLTKLLVEVEAEALSLPERRALERTEAVLDKVLSEEDEE